MRKKLQGKRCCSRSFPFFPFARLGGRDISLVLMANGDDVSRRGSSEAKKERESQGGREGGGERLARERGSAFGIPDQASKSFAHTSISCSSRRLGRGREREPCALSVVLNARTLGEGRCTRSLSLSSPSLSVWRSALHHTLSPFSLD